MSLYSIKLFSSQYYVIQFQSSGVMMSQYDIILEGYGAKYLQDLAS